MTNEIKVESEADDAAYYRREAEADRRVGSAAPWSRLVRARDGGGSRDFLDGKPVHRGALLELQAFDRVADPLDGEERSRRLDTGLLVSYETEWREADRQQVVLCLRQGGYTFTLDAHEGMRFRWPERTR